MKPAPAPAPIDKGVFYRFYLELTNLRWLLVKIGLFLFFAIMLAFLVTPSGKDLDYHFYKEDGLITVLSSFLLATAAAFSFVGKTQASRSNKKSAKAWGILALGFAYLSIDEVFQIHEQLGWLIDDFAESGIFRNWNDIVVIVYGVISIPILWLLFPQIKQHRRMIVLFALAFIAYGLHTITDSLVEDATTISIISEESFKLACVVCLSLGANSGMNDTLT